MTAAAFAPQEIETICKAIEHRRSIGIKRLKPDAVPEALLKKILAAANWAPSHGETDPWRFSVFTGDARLELGKAFAESYKLQAEAEGDFSEKIYESQLERGTSAPVWISIGMTPGTKGIPEEEEAMAVACAVQNFHIVASAHGLAGMWLSNNVMIHPYVVKFVGLNPPSRLLGFFPLGWPNIDWPTGDKTPIEEKITWRS